jgi:hypothetical protein
MYEHALNLRENVRQPVFRVSNATQAFGSPMANRKLRNRKRVERPKLSQVTQSLPPNIEIEALIGQPLDGPKELISNGLKVWVQNISAFRSPFGEYDIS